MKIAILYGRMCLAFRGSLGFKNWRTDPRGLSGSELGFVRICEELALSGHDVHAFTLCDEGDSYAVSSSDSVTIHSIDDRAEIDESYDLAISINEPELLRACKARVRACELWLNSFEYNLVGFDEHVDIWLSPSEAHRNMIISTPHEVEVTATGPKAYYRAKPEKWHTAMLGCDPWRYPDTPKVSGRVIYCSSPDRGLHLLLQEWPKIKRAVPHATLRIFYRLRAWIDGFENIAYNPAIEELRSRALYIDECLRRMSGPEWSIEVCDAVSRERIEREMCEAEVLAYPCDTTRWSEGFSCTILEACAARACPVIFGTDALGEIYGEIVRVVPRGLIDNWREAVIDCLRNTSTRDLYNSRCIWLANKLTWREHINRMLEIYGNHIERARPCE